MRTNQTDTILRHLVLNTHITQLEAIGLYRIFNLKGRITEIRGCASAPQRFQDFPVFVDSEMRDDGTGKTYARYSLSDSEKEVVRQRCPHLFDVKAAA